MNILSFIPIPAFSKKTAAKLIIASILLLTSVAFAYVALHTYDQIKEMDTVAAANRCDRELNIYADEDNYDVGADLCYKTTQIITNTTNEALLTRVYVLGSFSASFLAISTCYFIKAFSSTKKGGKDDESPKQQKRIAK